MAEISNEKKELRSKALYVGVIVILCLVFVVGFVYGLNTVLALEGTMVLDKDTRGVFAQPKTAEEVIEFLDNAYKSADEGVNKQVDNRVLFGIDADSLKTDSSRQFNETLLFLKSDFEDCLENNSQIHNSTFFEKANIRRYNFKADDIESFECKYFDRDYVYQCNSCDKESDELLSECDNCPSTDVYEKKTRDNYYICINIKPDAELINGNFPELTTDEIKNLMKDEIGDKTFDFDNYNCKVNSLKIILEVNRNTGNINYLCFEKNDDISAHISFTDYLQKVGDCNVSFNLTNRDEYSFTWAGIELNEDELIIEPKKTDNLTALLICDDPLKYNAVWSSDDESVATVDEDGYIKAAKEPGETTVKATYEFNGVVYTDECKVSVRVPVESMKMNKRSAKLTVGDTVSLKATVSPSDATVKTVKWYSENENIATVDENGTVTAKNSGTVVVYALSDDGYYKSTCEVNVK